MSGVAISTVCWCNMLHISKEKLVTVVDMTNLSLLKWIFCRWEITTKTYRLRAVRVVYYIYKLSMTVLLWPPSSAQWAALLVVFRPLNYSGFVFKPITNLNNMSCNLLMCMHYAGSHMQKWYQIKQMNELSVDGDVFVTFFCLFS